MKKSCFLFRFNIALMALLIITPAICSCSSSSGGVTPSTDSPFLGFEDNAITFYIPKQSGGSITKKANIVQVSETYYKTAEPVYLFTLSENQNIYFKFFTSGKYTSHRVRYSLDNTIQNHPISLINSPDEFTEQMPQFTVTNPYLKTDKMFVNFECDQNIHLEINFCIWATSYPYPSEQTNLTYIKQSIDDKHYLLFDTKEQKYKSVFLCPSNGVKNDIKNTMTIVCKPPSDYQYCNFYAHIEPSTSFDLFKSCITCSVNCKNVIEDVNKSYCIMQLDYTLLKDLTPTKEQCYGLSPTICNFRVDFMYEDEPLDNKQSTNAFECCFCEFNILWV